MRRTGRRSARQRAHRGWCVLSRAHARQRPGTFASTNMRTVPCSLALMSAVPFACMHTHRFYLQPYVHAFTRSRSPAPPPPSLCSALSLSRARTVSSLVALYTRLLALALSLFTVYGPGMREGTHMGICTKHGSCDVLDLRTGRDAHDTQESHLTHETPNAQKTQRTGIGMQNT